MNTAGHAYFWPGLFSQWAKFKIKDRENIEYNCCEQYMMAHKAMLFNDKASCELIMKCDDPKHQKKLGRLVANYNEDLWNKYKLQIVYEGNMFKYLQNHSLQKLLIETSDKLLVEASPFDLVWGAGLDERDCKKTDPSQWPGKNYLGKILTLVREDIKNNSYTNNVNDVFKTLNWL